MARQLQAWGINKGDRVVVLSENRPEWAVTDFATLLVGGIVVPIYATQTPEQVLFVLQHSEARVAVVSSQKQFEKVESVRAESKLERIVIMDDVEDMPDVPQMRYLLNGLDQVEDAAIEAFAHAIQPDDVATLIYTSGTTGVSKGAVLTHNNFAANAVNLVACWQITSADRFLLGLPLFHVHGLGNGLHTWLLSGCRMRLLERRVRGVEVVT